MPLLSTVNRALHQNFVQWGFHPLPDVNAYAGVVAIPDSADEQEVYVVLAEDADDFSLMSIVEPAGTADVITVTTAKTCLRGDVVIDAHGEVSVGTKPLSLSKAEGDFPHVLHQAITIAQDAHRAGKETRENRARFHKLCTLIGRRFDASTNLDEFDLRELIGWLKETLDLNPNKQLWAFLLGGASKNAVRFWSLGDAKMREEPWDRVAEFLTRYGAERGWVLG